ncbi:MAG: hypothetical protein AUH29_10535 [Candidatus Rokubacteria bacterium 13_1_40CM_69_27]|nr:MAG: hypothetical protein AUH29_10535 [Candidatus Rokubacteria bacterium 13_1_40CM_69_27]OLE37477.1 MAG: hypothetical protein AUG00_08095 [Candidatus Rokubacteria bacterium 13_1_20CM_2_70_7]
MARMTGRLILAVLGVTMVVAPPAAGEWFADLYAGGAFTESRDISVRGTPSGVAVDGKLTDVDFDDSFAFGARLGHWFDALRFIGVAADVSYFQPDISSQTVTPRGTLTGPLLGVPSGASFAGPVRLGHTHINVTAISLDLMLRWPLLTSEKFPRGRVQPYLTAGPGLYLTDVQHFDLGASGGVKAGAGLTWLFTKDIGVFAEYRATHFEPEVESGRLRLNTTIDTRLILGGITARF